MAKSKNQYPVLKKKHVVRLFAFIIGVFLILMGVVFYYTMAKPLSEP